MAHQQHVKLLRLRFVGGKHTGAHLVAQINLPGMPAFGLPQTLHNARHRRHAVEGFGPAVDIDQGFQLFNVVFKIHQRSFFRE